MYPYTKLKPANVTGTVDALQLCATGKPKSFAFISSTSVLDSDHYVRLSDSIMETGGTGVPESDDLEGSALGLATGYGQSKWVGEYIVREAGRRGLDGCVIRPGYIVGDSKSGSNFSPRSLLYIPMKNADKISNKHRRLPYPHDQRLRAAWANARHL